MRREKIMLKFAYKDAPIEQKNEMLSDIISKYNVSNRNELVQALGHCQSVLGCSQEEFANHPAVNISSRMLRTYKKDYLDIYTASFTKFEETPEVKDVDYQIEESALDK